MVDLIRVILILKRFLKKLFYNYFEKNCFLYEIKELNVYLIHLQNAVYIYLNSIHFFIVSLYLTTPNKHFSTHAPIFIFFVVLSYSP